MAGCDPASLAATAWVTRPAPDGAPQDRHRLPGTAPASRATVRRPPRRQEDPMAR